MKCECGKEFEGKDARQKYCSKKCRNLAGVRKHRNQEPVKGEVYEDLETGQLITQLPLKAVGLDPALRNTIHDPNPDWNPNKVITENNGRMTCPMCGKLSLTHFKMCSPVNGQRVYKEVLS